jgi:hypothetical protein
MTRSVSTQIPHELGKDEARRRLQAGFAQIESHLGRAMFGAVAFNNRWEGDRLFFDGSALGQKVSGRLEVLANSVLVELELPSMLAFVADRLLAKVNQETQVLLESKPASVSQPRNQ